MTKPTLPISIGSTASYLQRNYLDRAETAAGADARRVLAELRQSAARSFSTDPLALQKVLMLLEPPLSDKELGRGDAPSPSELAAYNALTLFAQHMQSSRSTTAVSPEICGRFSTHRAATVSYSVGVGTTQSEHFGPKHNAPQKLNQKSLPPSPPHRRNQRKVHHVPRY